MAKPQSDKSSGKDDKPKIPIPVISFSAGDSAVQIILAGQKFQRGMVEATYKDGELHVILKVTKSS